VTDTDHQAQERARATEAQKEAVKKRLADERTAREKAHAEQRDATAGIKPTPTQEENDLQASGVHVTDHEPDGSPPDPGITPAAAGSTAHTGGHTTRQIEPAKPASRGTYPTRSATPATTHNE
jgi:hypothetical protein